MKRSKLGKTGIEVTELCFGVLPMGPLQKNVSVEEGSETIALALKEGINFLDTAQMYQTYPHIKKAIEKTGIRPVIATKSTATTYEDMQSAVLEALEEMGLNHIDIFLLHAAKAEPDIFEIRKEALRCLVDYKRKGIIKAVGIATHNVKIVELAAAREDMDVVFPLINKAGRGIQSGTIEDMKKAIQLCGQHQKGIYLMKILGGGTLIDSFESAMTFGREIKEASAIAIGMVSQEEVIYNIKYFSGEKDLDGIISIRNNKIPQVLQFLCKSCGNCIEVCHTDAIQLDENNKATIDLDKCLQCGYCMAKCPTFCIRMI